MASFEINHIINNITTDGYDFGGGDDVKVDAGIQVTSTQVNGAYSTSAGSQLFNFGTIFGGNDGVLFDLGSNNSIVYNETAGVITGGLKGVEIEGFNENVYNLGKIAAGSGYEAVQLGESNDGLYNTGIINGIGSYNDDGVVVTSSNDTIENAGRIVATRDGVYVGGYFGSMTFITNSSDGLISGGQNGIFDSYGAFTLNNAGTIRGNVDCASSSISDDFIRNHGTITGRVELTTGNDTFNGKGGTSGEIVCGSGNDQVTAGKGHVTIDVGSGNSAFTLGHGHDQLIFRFAPAGQIETISNFKHGLDDFVLSRKDFPGLGPVGTLSGGHFHHGAPVNGHAQIDYFHNTGTLEYCPHGNAGPGEVFAILSNHAGVTASDFGLIA
jgi:hypothetical protein